MYEGSDFSEFLSGFVNMLCFSKRHRLPGGRGGRGVDGFKTIDVLDRGGARELYFYLFF
jgi:hypothetical protein